MDVACANSSDSRAVYARPLNFTHDIHIVISESIPNCNPSFRKEAWPSNNPTRRWTEIAHPPRSCMLSSPASPGYRCRKTQPSPARSIKLNQWGRGYYGEVLAGVYQECIRNTAMVDNVENSPGLDGSWGGVRHEEVRDIRLSGYCQTNVPDSTWHQCLAM